MTTNLTPDLKPMPRQERFELTVSEQDPLYPVAFKYTEQTGFDLETAADGSYNLCRWLGPDNLRLCLTLFRGLDLPTVITICDSVSLESWGNLGKLMASIGPLEPLACAPTQSIELAESAKAGSPAMQKLPAEWLALKKLQAETASQKPELTPETLLAFRASRNAESAAYYALQKQHDIEHNLVITNLILAPTLDEDGEPDYSEAIEEHESEIIALAIADFNSHFSVPQPPDPDESFIEEQTVNLHYDRHPLVNRELLVRHQYPTSNRPGLGRCRRGSQHLFGCHGQDVGHYFLR
jgi:hypothetical protein